MALTLEEALNQKEQNVDVMPKNITMQQASEIDTWDSLIYGQNRPNIVTVGSYKENPFERFSKGVYASLDSSIKDTIPAIQLGLSNADMAIGGYFGADEEVIKRKQANIATIQRNLLASQKERYKNITPQTAESWAFGIGQGVANLLTMYMTGGAAGGLAKLGLMGATKAATAQAVTGIATGVALENIEQQSERIPVNEQGDVDIEKITPEWAKKASIGTTAYLTTSALLEKYVGFGKQVKMWETPIKVNNKALKNISPILKQGGKGLLSEGLTEGLQSLASTGILLAEGTIKMSEMPDRLQQAWKEAVIGGILGGSVGVAVGINQQNNVKKMLNEEISKVVSDPQERENIVDAIWEAGTNEMTTVISKELELSSELNAKHGSIYDNMSGAIAQAIADSGAFVNESEADIAQYVSETAKMFANQVLAEANKRGCYIDEVLKAGDIAYMDGKIQLKAGDKVIAETSVMGDEILAQENKEAKEIAYTLLSMATGKDVKYIKMTLNNKSKNNAMKKKSEMLADMLAEADDKLDIDIDPSWKKYFYFDEDYSAQKTQSLIEQALNIIENGWQNSEIQITKRENEEAEYIENIVKNIEEKFNKAENLEELSKLYDNIDNELPQIAKIEFVYNNLLESYVKNAERLQRNEQEGIYSKDKGFSKSASRIDSRTAQTSNVDVDRGSINETFKRTEEIKSDKLSQIKGLPKEERVNRGWFDANEITITLTEQADYSTIAHELAHYWLDNMWAYTRTGKASSAYMNNFNAMADWLGIKEGQISITRNQHEKFARGYEKYLLQGYAPNGLIQGAFDDYDRWLKRVYKSAGQLKVKLSPDAIEFFNTMTTGELPEYTAEETQKEIWEKNLKEAEKTVEETRKIVVEKQTEFSGGINSSNTIPISSDGEQKQSAVFTKQAEMLGIAEELNYNKINIEEQNKKATEFVKNNLEQAERIVKGLENPPADILKNAIFNAYLKQMLAIGNNDAYLDALKTQSLELTRAGQEIASQRGAVENIFDAAFWIRKIENNAKIKLAIKKFGSFADETGENALSQMNEYIEREINSQLDAYLDATPEERTKIVEKLSKKITSEFGVKAPDKLYQSLYEPSEIRTKTNAYNYIYKVISGDLGISLTKEQANEVIAKTMQIQKAIESTKGRGGNPSVLFFKNLSEMENYANSISPSPALAVLTSTVGRGNMLFSLKSLALNIESNILNFLTEATIKRAVNGTMNLAVDPQVIKDYISFSNEVYNASGYQLSSMPELDPTPKILSEKMVSSQGEGKARALGRFFEQTIFKYGLGYPDLIFKDLAFVDTANLLATQYAKGDSKKATEIFKDVILVEPKTQIGKEIREIAINDALIATYQNKGTISKLALDIRNAINKGTKSLRLGDLLSPFVKTPANVIGLGLDYTFGGAYALAHFNTIINDFKNGELTETTKKSMRSLSRNGLGLLACFVIASLIDDEDYIPDYALLSPKERELVKLKGGVYNSIKIGDRYYSLDYFGTLGLPLVSILNARRGKDLKEKVFKYVQGAGFQALKLPVVGDLKKLLENTGRTLNQDVDNNIKMLEDAAIDFVSSRSIPAIITDVAKITDDYERDTQNKAFNRLMSKIPVLREQLPAQYNYGTGKAVETQDALSTLFAGARVKEEISNSVINEIDRLADKNTETKITLSKVTKLGKLSTLNDSQKIAAEKEFAKQYSKEVKALISSYSYKNADDSKKVKMINKVRSKVVERLKRQYGLNKRSK